MNWYYPATGKQTATGSFVRLVIGFRASNLILQNSGASDGDIEFSWNGTTTHGHVEPGEPFNAGDLDFSEIWVKRSSGGSVTFRIWAYAN